MWCNGGRMNLLHRFLQELLSGKGMEGLRLLEIRVEPRRHRGTEGTRRITSVSLCAPVSPWFKIGTTETQGHRETRSKQIGHIFSILRHFQFQ